MLRLKGYKNSIKKIHFDGCVEYQNGTMAYFLVEEKVKPESTTKLFDIVNNRYSVDVYMKTKTDKAVINRYSKIEIRSEGQASDFYTALIKHNLKKLIEENIYTPFAYAVKADASDIKTMKNEITLLYPYFKIADNALVEEILRTNNKAAGRIQKPQQPMEHNSCSDTVERGFMIHLE